MANTDEEQNIDVVRKRIRSIEAKALRKLRGEDDEPDPVPIFSPKKPPGKKGGATLAIPTPEDRERT